MFGRFREKLMKVGFAFNFGVEGRWQVMREFVQQPYFYRQNPFKLHIHLHIDLQPRVYRRKLFGFVFWILLD